MKKLILVCLLLPMLASARTYTPRTLSWACPTTRTDGSVFSCATDAAGYDLEVTKPGVAAAITELAASATSLVVDADPKGTTYRIRVCDKAGECSTWSNSVKKPAAPSTITLEI